MNSYTTFKLGRVGECHLTSTVLTGETEGYFQLLLICRIKQQLLLHGNPLTMQSVPPHFNQCFNSTTDKSTAISIGNSFCKWIKKVRNRLKRSSDNLLLLLILSSLSSWLQRDNHLVTTHMGTWLKVDWLAGLQTQVLLYFLMRALSLFFSNMSHQEESN